MEPSSMQICGVSLPLTYDPLLCRRALLIGSTFKLCGWTAPLDAAATLFFACKTTSCGFDVARDCFLFVCKLPFLPLSGLCEIRHLNLGYVCLYCDGRVQPSQGFCPLGHECLVMKEGYLACKATCSGFAFPDFEVLWLLRAIIEM
jgi:hypothetical protein